MKKLLRVIAMVLCGSFLMSMTAFAAEADRPTDEMVLEEYQEDIGSEVETISCSTRKGELTAVVACSYTVQWDEGYTGWFNNASFWMEDAYIDYKVYSVSADGSAWYNGSHAFQKYKINGLSILVTARVDEWGNVSLSMSEN